MKYDLIVIGGGPGGAMAARTAARDGLKTLLVDKRKDLSRITRFCSRRLVIGPGGFMSGKAITDLDKRIDVTFEIDHERYVLRLKGLPEDSVIECHGWPEPYFNDTHMSPSGYYFSEKATNNTFCGFAIDKDTLVFGIINEAEKAGCEVCAGTRCDYIEDAAEGVRVKLVSDAGEESLEASRAVVADGAFSRLVEMLGFNKGRPTWAPPTKGLAFILDNVETPFPEPRQIALCCPSLQKGSVSLGLWPPGRFQLFCGASSESKVNLADVLNKFMTDSPFSSWFRNSHVLDRQGCNMDLRPQVKEIARGNIMCVGDNLAFVESGIKGALGYGYQAAKMSKLALEGGDGNGQFNDFWQRSYEAFSRSQVAVYALVNAPGNVLDDAEVDTLFKWLQDKHFSGGKPADIFLDNREQFKAELPQIAAKILKEGGPPGRPTAG